VVRLGGPARGQGTAGRERGGGQPADDGRAPPPAIGEGENGHAQRVQGIGPGPGG
jgi:hypothetical protein